VSGSHYCPVCESYVDRFLPGGTPPRPDVKCPVCGANRRTRFAWLVLHRRTDLFDGRPKRMLHVAPERSLTRRLGELPGLEYLTADLEPGKAMVQMDITDIRFDDASFDVVYCTHVLEHVPDDRRAMRELLRVLRPGRWALLMMPITADRTFEDPSITDPAERERVFGHPAHVRRYGPDLLDRLREAGFVATMYGPRDVLDPGELHRLGLRDTPSTVVFHAVRPV
jgi:SAM-dependent methyltransferase